MKVTTALKGGGGGTVSKLTMSIDTQTLVGMNYSVFYVQPVCSSRDFKL